MKILFLKLLSFFIAHEKDSINISTFLDKTESLNSTNLSVKDFILSTDSLGVEELFEAHLYEAKLLLAESIIAHQTGDSIEARYRFESLFETLSYMNTMKTKDQFQSLEMNRLLSTSID